MPRVVPQPNRPGRGLRPPRRVSLLFDQRAVQLLGRVDDGVRVERLGGRLQLGLAASIVTFAFSFMESTKTFSPVENRSSSCLARVCCAAAYWESCLALARRLLRGAPLVVHRVLELQQALLGPLGELIQLLVGRVERVELLLDSGVRPRSSAGCRRPPTPQAVVLVLAGDDVLSSGSPSFALGMSSFRCG